MENWVEQSRSANIAFREGITETYPGLKMSLEFVSIFGRRVLLGDVRAYPHGIAVLRLSTITGMWVSDYRDSLTPEARRRIDIVRDEFNRVGLPASIKKAQ